MYHIYQYDNNYNDRFLFKTDSKYIASRICTVSSCALYYIKKEKE